VANQIAKSAANLLSTNHRIQIVGIAVGRFEWGTGEVCPRFGSRWRRKMKHGGGLPQLVRTVERGGFGNGIAHGSENCVMRESRAPGECGFQRLGRKAVRRRRRIWRSRKFACWAPA